jgi:lipopolysaccharide/colanic/teichoic acid biosynthesis glycosyltransferase
LKPTAAIRLSAIYKVFTWWGQLGSKLRIIFYGIATVHIEARVLPIGSSFYRAVNWGERAFTCILLFAVQPIVFVGALIIAILSKQSPFVAHCRVGQHGRTIWVLKLRTMWSSHRDGAFCLIRRLPPNQFQGSVSKTKHDPRVTSRFAAVCRHYSIDELPQLWNVVKGDLSLVGPRPLTRQEIDIYYAGEEAQLLTRKPGITGLWQIRGRSRLSYSQRRRLDLFLIRKWSLRLYLRILFTTIPNVLTGKDAY